MSRATRIYLAIDKDGKPVVARTVKYEMHNALLLMPKEIKLQDLTFWSVPDGGTNETKKVDLNFFLGKSSETISTKL